MKLQHVFPKVLLLFFYESFFARQSDNNITDGLKNKIKHFTGGKSRQYKVHVGFVKAMCVQS